MTSRARSAGSGAENPAASIAGLSPLNCELFFSDLKDVMEREVVSAYDHRHLNLEVPEFKTAQPTTENIAVAIWQRLDGKIPGGAKLHRVRVYEMADLFADFYGAF